MCVEDQNYICDVDDVPSRRLFAELMQLNTSFDSLPCLLSSTTSWEPPATLSWSSVQPLRERLDSGIDGLGNKDIKNPGVDPMNLDSTCPTTTTSCFDTSFTAQHESGLRSRRAVPHDLSILIGHQDPTCLDSPYSSTSSATLVTDFIQGVLKQNGQKDTFGFSIDPTLTLASNQTTPNKEANSPETWMQATSRLLQQNDQRSSSSVTQHYFGACESPLDDQSTTLSGNVLSY
jgi:hypothetical protein